MSENGAQQFNPHLFGKFFLLQRLAIGGMAEIFRARVVGAGGFEKELVVKRILPTRAKDAGFIRMLVNEAKLTVQLTHNNIAQIYECGIIDGTYFISMELVNGVSMKDVMAGMQRAGQSPSPEESIFLILQLLQGLDYAHKKTDSSGEPLHIVHCDVSPDNALVSFEGEVKLLDFGIARAATGLSNYKEGMLMGKLGYVAPEQASLEQSWDHRVDIFAAGILLYELLTRQKPFPRATDVESLISSRKAKVVPATTVDPRLPRDIDAILSKALAYDPEKRYADAKSFCDALVDVLFPTPHSQIQDLLGRQMQAVFADKILKQRASRGHDPLVMKVLSNIAAQQAAAQYEQISGSPALTPRPAPAPVGPIFDTTEPRARKAHAPRQRAIVRQGPSVAVAALVGLVFAVGGAVGLHYGEIRLRPGVVLVTSDPPGVPVTLDGTPTGAVTPAALEGIQLYRPHVLQVGEKGMRTASETLQPRWGEMVRRVHFKVQSAMGALVIESDPPGAALQLDDRAVGATPVTVPGVKLDQPHRLDLALPGYELDQFVVLPERDGTRYTRTLQPKGSKR
ncbi:MAG TPA: serine/threonine-protein kinase [Anaeromyxobacteraceae bacterium]|nr:serine/threonine-protein kinase [Anaeromyxobacteraceae bacterium]